MKTPRVSIFGRVEVAGIVGFSVLLCFSGLFYGLPQLLNADELYYADGAVRMLQPPYGDPQWYGAPASTLMNLLAPLFALYAILGDGLDSLALSYAACGLCFYVYARGFLGRLGAAAALAAFMFSPQILNLSQVVRMDVLLVLCLILCLHFSNRIVTRDRLRDYLFAGFALGAAVVTKYPGLLGAVCILLATVLAWRLNRGNIFRSYLFLLAAAAASVATAFLLAPYLFIEFREVLTDVIYEARSRHLSATSPGVFGNLLFYLGSGIPKVTGYGAAVAGFGGLAVALARRRSPEVWLLAAFGLAYLIFIVSMPLQWVRYALPMAPVVAVGIGLGAEEIRKRIPAQHGLAVAAALLLALGPSLAVATKTTVLKAAERDTRIEAAAWIEEHLPAGATIALETYAPQMSEARYRVYIPDSGRMHRMIELWPHRVRPKPLYDPFGFALSGQPAHIAFPNEIDYVVTSDWRHRYAREAHWYGDFLEVYDHLDGGLREIKQFQPDRWKLGMEITIYRRIRESRGGD